MTTSQSRYPHPLIEIDDDGNIDISNAYDDGIGEWDERNTDAGQKTINSFHVVGLVGVHPIREVDRAIGWSDQVQF